MADNRVLYIEDNPANRLLVKRTLEAAGYSVLEAVDGPSGIRAAQESQPDLILLDISLPEIDGYELARRFADLPHLADVPILAVTANVMKGDKERALAAGCDGYIPKPINIDELPDQVEDALRRASFAGIWAAVADESQIGDELAPGLGLLAHDSAPDHLLELDWSSLSGVDDDGADLVAEVPQAAGPPQERDAVDVVSLEDQDESADDRLVADAGDDDELLAYLLAEMAAEGVASPSELEHEPASTDEAGPAEEVGSEGGPVSDADVDAAGTEPDEEQAVPVVEPTVPAEDVAERPPGAREPEQLATEGDSAVGSTDDGAAPPLGDAALVNLVEAMETLVHEVGAVAVVIMRGETALASVGQLPSDRVEELAAIAADGFRSADFVASLLGSDEGCREQITEIGDYLVYTVVVDTDAMMLTAMPSSIPLGAVRLWVRRSAARVGAILQEAS